jgi:hypothetical protein
MSVAEKPYDSDVDVLSGAGVMQVLECGDQLIEWTAPL